MSDFEDKLNAILSNPDAMAQVMHLAQSLGGSGVLGGGQPQQEENPPLPSDPPPCDTHSNPFGDIGKLGDLFGQIDPGLITRLLPLLGELNQGGSDERVQLLYALRPFLKPERQDKVDRAVRAARLIHVGKKLLTSLGDSHV
ncbi:MAG: hypothetical protein IKC03_00690 [Oscillospiraceae bacterium]|nr:hypothetical protein [Oscillospiraceae bacterium]